jgi:transposase
MAMGRPKAALVLSPEQRAQLESMASSRSLPAGLVTRVRIVLLSAAGKMNQQIARQLGLTNATVGKWRRRFVEQGVSGLHDELRPGRPRPISDERVAQLVRKTLETKPKDGTHWSVRQIAGQTRLSKSTVHRIWQAFGLEPHRQRHFKLSTDPFFGEKVRDIVGLYLKPPENAVVLCVDEKSQIQALERTQPMLPMGLCYPGGSDPRLPASWDYHSVCRAGHGQGHGAHAVSATSSASRVSGFPAADRPECTSGLRRARDRGQLRDPQASSCEALAGGAGALSCALHSNLRLVAESGGDLVQPDHPTRDPARYLSQGQGTGGQNRSIRAARQPESPALCLDGYRGFDLCQSPATM